jgi:hypothetical protein
LLTQFSDALKEIELLVVIGNSLRDDHLRNTIINRVDRLNIILVNPAANEQRGIVNCPEVTHAVALGVEQFINLGLPEFDALLTDLDRLPFEQHCARISAFSETLSTLSKRVAGLTDDDQRQLDVLRSGSVESKIEAVHALAMSRNEAVLAALRKLALTDLDESVQIAAIDALVDALGPAISELLSEIALSLAPLPVRAEATLALSSFKGDALAGEAIRRTMSGIPGNSALYTILASSLKEA